MTEHYTKNTLEITHWCNKCGRRTQHYVSDGRMGRCMEHETGIPRAKIPPKDWPDEPQQGELFKSEAKR